MNKSLDRIIDKIEKPYIPKEPEVPVSLIKVAVADAFYTTVATLEGKGRDESIALTRQVAMYLIRQKTDLSLDATGRQLGNRTPATVSFGYQKIAKALKKRPSLRRKISEIEQILIEQVLVVKSDDEGEISG